MLENRYQKDFGKDCLVSIDGVDFMIEEPYPYDREYSKFGFCQNDPLDLFHCTEN